MQRRGEDVVQLEVEVESDSVVWAVSRMRRDEAFDFIVDVDSHIAELEFTRRLYEYARDVLIQEGEEVG